jgi:hypothetical protein
MTRRRIVHKIPAVGMEFTREYKGERYKMTVVKGGMGAAFKVGTDIYRTPSQAARSVTKTEVNGWVFWRIEKKGA